MSRSVPLLRSPAIAAAALAVAALALSGCKVFMSGHSADYSIIVTGTGELDPATDTMQFQVVYEGLGVTCTGSSQGRSDGVQGHTGGYTCTDGRTGGGKSQVTHMQGGTGFMTDNCGNAFEYVWGIDAGAITAAGDQYRRMNAGKQAPAADKCALAKAKTATPATAAAAPETPEEQRLARLKKLYDDKLIDDAEYKVQKQAVLNRMLERAQGATAAATAAAPAVTMAPAEPMKAGDIPANVAFGRYHALVIGNDSYAHLPKLKTARNDAKAVAALLEKDYGFSVTLLLDAGRAQIIENLDALTEKLGAEDNLVIYYAGHGWLEQDSARGYWLPIDAQPNRRANWISNTTLTDTLSSLRAKHVMVIADSCFSGALVRGANVGLRAGDYWRRMAAKWTRVAMVSGGLEPVADGTDSHSPFAKALIGALQSNASVMDGTQLFEKVRRPVMLAAKQTPQYSDVRQAGHDGGDFLFVRRK